LSPTEWRTILAKLRRARLLAGEDPHNPGHLDTHPLVREYFGEQLRSERIEAWRECSRRLYNYYKTLAPELPESFREMEPLFLAIICGCNAGLFREALHEVYIPRIQRENASFAGNVLGARGALLSVLAHFFEHRRWGSPVETALEEQSLTAEDQLLILMQAGTYLTATRGFSAPEARICYERAESLCNLLNRPQHLKDLKTAIGLPNCAGSAACFSRPLVLTRPKSRPHSAKPSESQRSRNRFRYRNAPKEPTQNTVGKKRARQKDVDSDYLFGNFLQLPAFLGLKSCLQTSHINSTWIRSPSSRAKGLGADPIIPETLK
jgi:hypothetical protein